MLKAERLESHSNCRTNGIYEGVFVNWTDNKLAHKKKRQKDKQWSKKEKKT